MAKSSVKKPYRKPRLIVEKFPRLTPLKIFALLRELDYRQGIRVGGNNGRDATIENTRDALAYHVKNALRRAGSR